MQVYSHRLWYEVEMIQGKIVRVRWVMISKGIKQSPIIRCRLVATIFASGVIRDDIFAGTPPVYAFRTLLSHVASQGRSTREKIMI